MLSQKTSNILTINCRVVFKLLTTTAHHSTLVGGLTQYLLLDTARWKDTTQTKIITYLKVSNKAWWIFTGNLPDSYQ